MAARIWTLAQRQRQAEAIRRWKPWTHSTGPKSLEGKAQVAHNAFTGGTLVKIRQSIKALNQALRDQRNWMK
jgi:hypothetical protein